MKLKNALGAIGLTRLQQLEFQRAEQLRIISEAEEAGIEADIGFKERRLQVEEEFAARKKEIEDQAALNSEVTFANIATAFEVLAQKASVTAGGIARIFNNVLARGLGNAFQAVGAAIASGQNGLQAFADAIKATFADLASSIGDYYIKAGVARAAAGDPGAAAMIAAGAALKVFSGVLGASGASGGGSTASGGGGSDFSGGSTPEFSGGATEEQDLVQAEAQTAVSINVQGDILDSDETGTRIASVLSEAFGKQGVVLTDARIS
jgi:hypothetical protein